MEGAFEIQNRQLTELTADILVGLDNLRILKFILIS
ncbi:MAG: hypothetical protein ACI88H_003960 [Cocleimonas sp.]|jgi:hypothetical protein